MREARGSAKSFCSSLKSEIMAQSEEGGVADRTPELSRRRVHQLVGMDDQPIAHLDRGRGGRSSHPWHSGRTSGVLF
jgi:hypothetical protein